LLDWVIRAVNKLSHPLPNCDWLEKACCHRCCSHGFADCSRNVIESIG
jgi:hypothetical protein